MGGWLDPIRLISGEGPLRLTVDAAIDIEGPAVSMSFQYFLLSAPPAIDLATVRQALLDGDIHGGLPAESLVLSRQYSGSSSPLPDELEEDILVHMERDRLYYLAAVFQGVASGAPGEQSAFFRLSSDLKKAWAEGGTGVLIDGKRALAVPEADAWALALCGLAVAGLSARVRQRRSSPAAAPAA